MATKKLHPEELTINFMEFETAQDAWLGINEFMLLEERLITKRGGAIYGTELISYNNFIRIKNMKIDPDFDFGTTLSYKDKKWSALVNNYVNFNYLDLIKSEIQLREKKGGRSYNYVMQFANYHGGGKDCLVGCNFTKRVGKEEPVIIFEVRVSEVTQRLIFDFLLVQRIIEYVYGVDKKVEVHFIAPSMFITAERFMAFHNVRSIKKLLRPIKEAGKLGRFQKQILKKLKYYSNIDPMSIQYRSSRRAAQSLQKDGDGKLVSGAKPLLAKQLGLLKVEDFPDEIVTQKQKAKYRRTFLKPENIKKKKRNRNRKAKKDE